eukprot:TRINITY_DN1982_c0_g1_i1.p1 TRINITY_DN1982_c0_g1~~TRINITY_DN1982_c0_g1_i1.p1  ORF type:complete len:127 (-),score=5.60 TRINITY_DN1982_c0_g1_i1:987-1367(-)
MSGPPPPVPNPFAFMGPGGPPQPPFNPNAPVPTGIVPGIPHPVGRGGFGPRGGRGGRGGPPFKRVRNHGPPHAASQRGGRGGYRGGRGRGRGGHGGGQSGYSSSDPVAPGCRYFKKSFLTDPWLGL